jgi:hypothetical protein
VLKDGDIELDFPADTLSKVVGEEASRVGAVIEEAAHGHVKVAHVRRGSRDYVVEVSMLDGVHLKDIDIDINTLVRPPYIYIFVISIFAERLAVILDEGWRPLRESFNGYTRWNRPYPLTPFRFCAGCS